MAYHEIVNTLLVGYKVWTTSSCPYLVTHCHKLNGNLELLSCQYKHANVCVDEYIIFFTSSLINLNKIENKKYIYACMS